VTIKKKKVFSTETETHSNANELGLRKKFTPKDLISFYPLNDRQKDFFEAFNSNIPVIVQDGPAGTGKSILSIYSALSQVFDPTTEYERLIVIRSAVETRGMGFLPGSLEEKMQVYEQPYVEIIKDIVKYKTAYDNMKALGVYEFMTTTYLRGLTFDNAIIVVDEAQNADIKELSTIFTRIGRNSKIIINGDSAQDDLARKREKSGFEHFKLILTHMPYELRTQITYGFHDIVRSELVKQYIMAEASVTY
jgi:phosphate starvation-inducible protein PhoH